VKAQPLIDDLVFHLRLAAQSHVMTLGPGLGFLLVFNCEALMGRERFAQGAPRAVITVLT
jgi:hypothetical protein